MVDGVVAAVVVPAVLGVCFACDVCVCWCCSLCVLLVVATVIIKFGCGC